MKRWGIGASRKTWAATIAVALTVVTMVAGGLVWAAAVSAPLGPPPPPGVLPAPSYPTPPPTVWPEGFWGPHPVETPRYGPHTSGTKVTVGSGPDTRTVQLPPTIYVTGISSLTDMVNYYGPGEPQRHPRIPSVGLATVDGKSEITVDADLTLWIQTDWKPPQDGNFDWLYEALGVSKGSDRKVKVALPPVRTDIGTATAGSMITIGDGSNERILQLPPNAYLLGKLSYASANVYCREWQCPRVPAVLLTVDGTKLIVIVDADLTIFMFSVGVPPPENVSAFDWLYETLGVPKGSEVRVGPPTEWTQ